MRFLFILGLSALCLGICGCGDGTSWVIVINNGGGNLLVDVEDPPDCSNEWASWCSSSPDSTAGPAGEPGAGPTAGPAVGPALEPRQALRTLRTE